MFHNKTNNPDAKLLDRQNSEWIVLTPWGRYWTQVTRRTLGGRRLANTCGWRHATDEVLTAAAEDWTGVALYTHSAVGHRTVNEQ